jgi:hypothetical protein
MTVAHYHSITLLLIAHKAAQRADAQAAAVSSGSVALTEDAVTAITMAVSAAEAFINELADHLHLDAVSGPIAPQLQSTADLVAEIETEQGSVLLKYHVASLALTGGTFNRGAAPFQEFAELVRLRNAIVHLRPGTKYGQKITDSLAQRGLAMSEQDGRGLPWFDRLLTPKTARWSVQVARDMMLAVLDMAKQHAKPHQLVLFNSTLSRDDARFK